MKGSTMRFLQVLLVALFMVVSAVGPAYAQSSPSAGFGKVSVQNDSGWRAMGRHAVADDFAVVCPIKEVLDPSHPCSETNSGVIQLGAMRDFVLVCPVEEVLEDHPCAERRAQVFNARPQDYVLVCPVSGYDLPGNHPCNQRPSIGKFEMPKDYVVTCPNKEVLEPGHPCAARNRS